MKIFKQQFVSKTAVKRQWFQIKKCQKKYQWLAKVSKNYYDEGRKMQQRKCTCRRMLNIDSDQRGRIGETVIFTEVVFFDSLFCWFSPPACVGVAGFGMYLVTGNTGCPYIFCSSLLLSKALNPPQKSWVREGVGTTAKNIVLDHRCTPWLLL